MTDMACLVFEHKEKTAVIHKEISFNFWIRYWILIYTIQLKLIIRTEYIASNCFYSRPTCSKLEQYS